MDARACQTHPKHFGSLLCLKLHIHRHTDTEAPSLSEVLSSLFQVMSITSVSSDVGVTANTVIVSLQIESMQSNNENGALKSNFNVIALERAHHLILCVSLALCVSPCLLKSTLKRASDSTLIKRVYSSTEKHQYH